MNSRARVLASIRRENTDRIPYDFWAEEATINRIFNHVGHDDLERILIDFNVDIRHINHIVPKERKIGDFYRNYWGEQYIYKETPWGRVREDIKGALSDSDSLDEMKTFDWPSHDMFDYSELESLCNKYENYAIIYGNCDIWQRPTLVRGFEKALLDHILHPEIIHFLARKFTDFYKEDYERAYKKCKGRIDIFLIYSDFSGQNGPLISRQMFREFVAPYLKEMIDLIHELGAYCMFHSCGLLYPYINELIELGVDILDPIQPIGESMKPENLLNEFGGRICFHGGIDTQNLLPFGSPDEVEQEVKHYASVFGYKGGYICSPAHFFQPDIPPENIIAFYRALV